MPEAAPRPAGRWLFLIHQLPPRPLYLRAQVRRRLVQVGAVPLKSSVYVLPDQAECLEDVQWISQEAVAGGGEACVLRGEILDAGTLELVTGRFRDAITARYRPIKDALETHLANARRARRSQPESDGDLTRLRRQVNDIAPTDFFDSAAGREVRMLMNAIEQRQQGSSARKPRAGDVTADLAGRVWVTRRDPHVDRLSTAWLIRRFVDPAARFRFVDPAGGAKRAEERSFDMLGADFTHEGGRCTFETIQARLGLEDPAVTRIAQIVHDLDLKETKYGRPETAGIQQMIHGLNEAHPDSLARINAALPMFDALYASFGGRFKNTRPAGARTRRRRVKGRKA